MKIAELVYESLIGESIDPIEGVPNAFAPGSDCEGQYQQMLEAYARLRGRLGVWKKIRMLKSLLIRCWRFKGICVWKCLEC